MRRSACSIDLRGSEGQGAGDASGRESVAFVERLRAEVRCVGIDVGLGTAMVSSPAQEVIDEHAADPVPPMWRIDVHAAQHCVRRRLPGGRRGGEVTDEETYRRTCQIGGEHEAPVVGQQTLEVLPALTRRPGRVRQRLMGSSVGGEEFALESDQLVDVACFGTTDRHHDAAP